MPYKQPKHDREQEQTHDQVAQDAPDIESPVSSHELRRAVAMPRAASPDALLGLQRTYGNQAVQRLLQADAASVQRFKWNPFKKKTQEAKPLDLNNLLRNKEFYRLFYVFSVAEFSTENIECWSDIEAYKANPNMPRARRIYNQYFADENATRAVNIPNKVRQQLRAVMNEAQEEGVGNRASAAGLFDSAEQALTFNLSDTYSRFTNTPEYANWHKANPNV